MSHEAWGVSNVPSGGVSFFQGVSTEQKYPGEK